MYSIKKIRVGIHQLVIEKQPFDQNHSSYEVMLMGYISKLKQNGYQSEMITLLKPNRVINFKYTSPLWLNALLKMQQDRQNAPEGVTVEGEQWIIEVSLFVPCKNCRTPAQAGCGCLVQNINSME